MNTTSAAGDGSWRMRAKLEASQPGAAPGSGDYFRAQGNAPSSGRQPQPAAALPRRMIETIELAGELRSSVADPRTGPDLVADAVAKPVSVWLPAGGHPEAVVLAGVDASARVSSQGDPRPVLLRITGSPWSATEDGTTMQFEVDCRTVTGAACRPSRIMSAFTP